MQADVIPKILRPCSNVLTYQVTDIRTSRTEQSNNISCSVVSQMRDVQATIYQVAARYSQLFARGLFRESGEPVKYVHLAELSPKY